MNIDEYENKYRSLYEEFAEIVQAILEKAIANSPNVPTPQSVQCRAKAAKSLRLKLQERGIANTESIESEIKDLAGARLIFYTNGDVDGFLNSGLIQRTLDIDWNATKVHHPTEDNADQRYRAIHYTVSLGEARNGLPEYAKFSGMRCEIQIQTILNHAWSETTHDMLYKPKRSQGFGDRAFEAIKKRMMRVMDDYLRPAGYEIQKVQRDFERLMEGKALFDRGTLEALKMCQNNNERHEILSTIKEYVVPNYDDIQAEYPGLRAALLDAVVSARDTPVAQIESPFGNFDGKSRESVVTLALDILDNLRYVDVEGTFLALLEIYKTEPDKEVREHLTEVVRHLAAYNLDVWRQAGLYVQVTLAIVIDRLSAEDRVHVRSLLLTVWHEVLNAELRGTTWSADTVTISTGAVPMNDNLKTLRDTALDGLFQMFLDATGGSQQLNVITTLTEATRTPSQGHCSNELRALVIENTKRVVDFLAAHAADLPYDLLEHVEHDVLWWHRYNRQFPNDDRFKADCGAVALGLLRSIEGFRDVINTNGEYVRYKTLVGFKGVFPPDWEDDEFYQQHDEYRMALVVEYIADISDANQEEWYRFLEICAATESDDLATFPIFAKFLQNLAAAKPAIALQYLERGSENILKFLPALLVGLSESGSKEVYQAALNKFLAQDQHLAAIARHFRPVAVIDPREVRQVLDRAIAAADNLAVIECLCCAVEKHEPQQCPLLEEVFLPAIQYLSAHEDPRWIRGVWYLRQGRSFLKRLSLVQAEEVLTSLLPLQRIDHEAERILSLIASKHAAAVWNFFAQRIAREKKSGERYDSIPYRFSGLEKELGKDPHGAIGAVRAMYGDGDSLFQYRGGRLLSAAFPDLSDAFAQELLKLLPVDSDEHVEFVLGVLQNYQGATAIYPILQRIIEIIPEEDDRLATVIMCFDSTGVVSGEFGFAEAFREKKRQIESWLGDHRPRVAQFAALNITRLEARIASETRRAEQGHEMRVRDFENDNDDKDPNGGSL